MAHVGFVQGKLFPRGGFFSSCTCRMQNLHSPNRDGNCALQQKCRALTTGLSGNFPEVAFELSLEVSAEFHWVEDEVGRCC